MLVNIRDNSFKSLIHNISYSVNKHFGFLWLYHHTSSIVRPYLHRLYLKFIQKILSTVTKSIYIQFYSHKIGYKKKL